MKKIMTAALGLSLLSGRVVFAQNTATTSTPSTMKSTEVQAPQEGVPTRRTAQHNQVSS